MEDGSHLVTAVWGRNIHAEHRSCTMSSYLNGPWSCGSYSCDKGEHCQARYRNEAEAAWLEARRQGVLAWRTNPEHEWANAWCQALGLPETAVPEPTIDDARRALWWS